VLVTGRHQRGRRSRPDKSTARDPARYGVERAKRILLVLLGLHRLSYLIPAVVYLGSPVYRSAFTNAALVGAAVGWNVAIFWRARREGWFMPWMGWSDVVLATVLVIAVPANLAPAEVTEAENWSVMAAPAAVALAGAAIGRVGPIAAALAALVGARAWLDVQRGGAHDPLVDLLTNINGLVWYAVIGYGLYHLWRQGHLVERINARRLAVEARLATDRARNLIRLARYRALHGSVRTTLSALAHDRFDHRAAQMRLRCANEADYLRRVLTDDRQRAGTLADKLTELAGMARSLGLRVYARRGALPPEVSQQVVEAIGDAAIEALNNVVRHAGVDEVWLTATHRAGVLTISVEDHGVGFDPLTETGGFGLSYSVFERMHAVGGLARVVSQPGAGTRVDLTVADSPMPATTSGAPSSIRVHSGPRSR
jgi:hypothetical protein